MIKSKFVLLAALVLATSAFAQFSRRDFGGRDGRRNNDIQWGNNNGREDRDRRDNRQSNQLAPWIQNIVTSATNLQLSSQSAVLSQGDLSVAMQKLNQAQQLLVEVQNIMSDLVPAGVCAVLYEESNYAGARYEVLSTDGDNFNRNYMYSSFSRFPIFVGDINPFKANRVNINDRISSVAVARGCKIVLSEHDGYRGYSHEYRDRAPTVLAPRQYSSARCSCQ